MLVRVVVCTVRKTNDVQGGRHVERLTMTNQVEIIFVFISLKKKDWTVLEVFKL